MLEGSVLVVVFEVDFSESDGSEVLDPELLSVEGSELLDSEVLGFELLVEVSGVDVSEGLSDFLDVTV